MTLADDRLRFQGWAGYGVANRGETALHASLASCAQGVTVVNIDNQISDDFTVIAAPSARASNAKAGHAVRTRA
mgnify:CR=1 FL=1